MTRPTIDEPADDAPLRVLFPDYWRLDSLVRGEVEGVPDTVLDWTSAQYGWAGWSIRQQTSHLASLVFRWLLVRWGEQLYPEGGPVSEAEMRQLNSPDSDRRLDDTVYHEVDDILGQVDRAIGIARTVLQYRTVGEGRSLVVARPPSRTWALMAGAHPRGVKVNKDGSGSMTLEATFRHMYFEFLTHMFNMQRIKRALGVPAIVKLPDGGYHMVDGWDASEAPPGSEKA